MAYYGHKWGSTRPPGLPETARTVGAAEDAAPFLRTIYQLSMQLGLTGYARAVTILADNESSATYARPANNFDARPEAERPAGKPLITAWGVYQYNRGHFQRLGRDGWDWQSYAGFRPGTIAPEAATRMPWETTPAQEVVWPLLLMAQAYIAGRTSALRRGASRSEAEQAGEAAVYFQHSSPGLVKRWLEAGAFPAQANESTTKKLSREVPAWTR